MSKLAGYPIPTDKTVGAIGDIYTSIAMGADYECIAIHEIKTDTIHRYYVWVRIVHGSDNSGGENDGASGGALPNDAEQLAMLIDADMLPAVHDASGAILTDEKGNIVLRY